MSIPDHLYVISNGSTRTYPDNSLTQFCNQLPNVITVENNENIRLSLEAIGFCCKFRNLVVPEHAKTPSVIVTDIGLFNSSCMLALPKDLIRAKVCMNRYKFDFDNIGGYKVIFKEYFLEDRWYTEENVKEMCETNNKDNLVNWYFIDKKLLIESNIYKDYWILIHPTFLESFNMTTDSFLETPEWLELISKEVNSRIFDRDIYNNIFQRIVTYKGEPYFGFYLNMNASKIVGKECKNLHKEKIPEIIKVRSSVISSQIYNDTHSKDLIVFCPDFKNIKGNYYYKEFDQIQKIKLENTTLSNVDISLRDENDKKLQLLPGVPTIVKLKFEKVRMDNKSFNVRLTSKKVNIILIILVLVLK